jgi:predicted methyltransferase
MHFTVEAQNFAKPHLTAGAIAVDATCGNGFDTLFMAEQVGSSGVVYGVDIQSRAIETVKAKLQAAGTLSQCRLVVGSHSQLKAMIEPEHAGGVSVVMFNLGYLPLGDKTIVTKPETTLAGLDQAFEVLRPGGFLSVLAYPGHPGGQEESQCVADWISRHADELRSLRYQDPGNRNSPVLWALTKVAGAAV